LKGLAVDFKSEEVLSEEDRRVLLRGEMRGLEGRGERASMSEELRAMERRGVGIAGFGGNLSVRCDSIVEM